MVSSQRIPWIDAAKAYGIALVFYGHFGELMYRQGYASALWQLKLIYSFHMPLFFVLAGYVQRERGEDFGRFVRQRMATRLVPALFFNLLAFGIFAIRGITAGTADWRIYLYSLLSFLRGYPSFDFATWFLVCLFTVEVIHFGVGRYVRSVPALLGAAAFFLGIGWLVLAKIDLVVRVTGISQNFWFVHEALIAYAFYLLGQAGRWLSFPAQQSPPVLRLLILGLSAAVTLVTFDLNRGPFTGEEPVVLMAESVHGFMPLFVLTAVTGSLAIIVLAQLIPVWSPVSWLGKNTLVLMCLDGLLHDFVNPGLAGWLAPAVPDSPQAVFVASTVVTLLSLAACAPVVAFLNRYLPQLVGRRASQRTSLSRGT